MISGDNMHFNWPEDVQRANANGDVRAMGFALLRAGIGVKVLPVETIEDGHCTCGNLNCERPGKHPVKRLVERGHLDATADPQTWSQWNAVNPSRMGVVLGPNLAVVDDDSGNFNPGDYGISGTYVEVTQRRGGRHHYIWVPQGKKLATRQHRELGLDIKSGTNGYVIMAPSDGYEAPNVRAPIIALRDDSLLWDLGAVRAAAKTVKLPPATRHQRSLAKREAQRVRHQLLKGPYGDAVRLLLDGRWREVRNADGTQRYLSQSEADGGLLLMATYFSRDPLVLDLLMRVSGLIRSKWDQVHTADGLTYGQLKIINALTERDARQRTRLAELALMLGCAAPNLAGAQPSATPLEAPTVIYRTPLSRKEVKECILRMLAQTSVADGPDGWMRLPIGDIAKVTGICTKTVQRAINDLEKAGLIEAPVKTEHVNGYPIKLRWARLKRH